MISQKSIQEVLGIAQVDELIQEYVSLKRRGVNMIGLCPFHDEKTPSFTVSPSKNIYKCFGCGKGGGPVQFLMEHDSLSFPEAIRALAGRYNVSIEDDNQEDAAEFAEKRKLEESYYILNEFAGKYFQDNLFETADGKLIGLSYFKERGFLESTIKKFGLGYSLNERKHFTELALQKQYKEEFLRDLGLTSQKGFDFFRSRVMFPIHSVSGKIIAFAGRTLSTQKSQPKYINSPETPIYTKRKVLYGMHLAKSSIRKQDECLIVEGYTDVISMVQNGVENIVASSGTSLTAGQVQLVKRYTDNVTFLYDGDAAGVKAALRGLDIVLEHGMNVSVVLLPEDEDPDSFIKAKGYEAFQEFKTENAKDFIFFKMDLLLKDSDNDPIKKSKVIKDIISSIAKLRDPIKRSLYVKQCGQVLDVREDILVKEVNKAIKNEIKQKQLDKKREARMAERAKMGTFFGEGGPAPSGPVSTPFPNEQPEASTYDEYADYPEEKIGHDQSVYKSTAEYQERDLASLIISSGDQVIEHLDSQQSVAEFIYTEIADVIDYFDNELYKKVIVEGFSFVERNSDSGSITDHFVNHQEKPISEFAVDAISSPYEFADWNRIGVYLNQKMPEKNYHHSSKQSIFRFKFKKLSKIIQGLQDQISQKDLAPERRELLLKAFIAMQKKKRELSQELGVVIPPK